MKEKDIITSINQCYSSDLVEMASKLHSYVETLLGYISDSHGCSNTYKAFLYRELSLACALFSTLLSKSK